LLIAGGLMKKYLILNLVVILLIYCIPAVISAQTADDYYNSGAAALDLKNYNTAIDNFNKCLEADPKYADAYYKRGLCYYNKQEYENAIADWQKAGDLNAT
jgi:tetratricopeptide (TPR) repeat protein